MKPYTLVRHLGEPAVNALEFETGIPWGPRKLANFTAEDMRDLAMKMKKDAEWSRKEADDLDKDAAKLRELADSMDSARAIKAEGLRLETEGKKSAIMADFPHGIVVDRTPESPTP